MSITELAITKSRVTTVALLVATFAGINAYNNLSRAEDPGFIIRTAMVTTYFPGASPSRVEELVTDKLEKAIQEMPEIDFINSTSKTGVSLIFVNVQERYKTLRPIWDSLRRKVTQATGQLPTDVIGPIINDEFGDVFGTVVGVRGEGFSYAELKDVADEVRDELLLIDEAAKVQMVGAQEERVFVEYQNAKLAEVGLSASQLQQILSTRNIIIPGGSITTGVERISLEPTGNFNSVDDLAKTIIPGSGGLIYLEDIATVRRGYVDPPSNLFSINGRPALGLAVSLREGGNIIDLGAKVAASIEHLRGQYPIGVDFDFVSDQAFFVQKKVDDFVNSLLQAVGIVLLVMLITLGVRTGMVVASLIPMAMIVSLFVMALFGIGLDQMSLASLIIALGMLVDNSIVMSESILVGMREGKSAKEAAIASASELRIPLLTSSATTAAAFLPIFLAESSTGEYTAPLFKVVSIALLSSWVLSLTMIPLFCVAFLRVKPSTEEGFSGRFYRWYRASLGLALRNRAISMVVVFAVFMGAMQLFALIPNIFFPPNDKPIFTVDLELPIGAPIEATAALAQDVDNYLEAQDSEALINWMTAVGSSPPRFYLGAIAEPAKPNFAQLVVNCTTQEGARPLMAAVEQHVLEHYPDARVTVDWLALGPPAAAPVQVLLSGRDEGRLFQIVETVKNKMAEYETKNIRDNWGLRSKKLLVDVNQPRALRAGLTSSDVAISLQTNLSGIETTQYREGDEVIPVVLRAAARDRQDLSKLATMNIFAQQTGASVPLKQVADVTVAFEPAQVLRRDRLKTVTISADLSGSPTALEIATALEPWLNEQRAEWGVGYQWLHGGEIEQSGKANASIGAKMPVAMLIIILLLVSQFNSIRKPLIILATVPLGMIGVSIGLLAAKSYFGFMTLLGVISLVGIVINNAIVLLERIQLEIDENGRTPQDAVMQAAQRRMRPILLTTATTVGGLLPLWLGGGPMWEPMAISIIFGLLFATVLTLGVVPILYSIFFRVRFAGLKES